MAYHLMQRDRPGPAPLADALQLALGALRHCQRCNTFTEAESANAACRASAMPACLCVVETPVDMNMMEQTHAYSGLYYVLMGRVSPLDGIGPRELQFEQLLARPATAWCRKSFWRPISPTKAKLRRTT
jgi:recombination protein RecR